MCCSVLGWAWGWVCPSPIALPLPSPPPPAGRSPPSSASNMLCHLVAVFCVPHVAPPPSPTPFSTPQVGSLQSVYQLIRVTSMGGLFAQLATVLAAVLRRHAGCRTVVWLVDREHARLWTIKQRGDSAGTGLAPAGVPCSWAGTGEGLGVG